MRRLCACVCGSVTESAASQHHGLTQAWLHEATMDEP